MAQTATKTTMIRMMTAALRKLLRRPSDNLICGSYVSAASRQATCGFRLWTSTQQARPTSSTTVEQDFA